MTITKNVNINVLFGLSINRQLYTQAYFTVEWNLRKTSSGIFETSSNMCFQFQWDAIRKY